MKAAAEAGGRAPCADSRTPLNLVLGASLLLPFVRTGGFGSDALALGPVGAWLSPGPIPPDRGAHDRQAAGISTD